MAYNVASTTEQVRTESSFSLNRDFVKSIPGMLKISELVINIVIWICVGSTLYFPLIAAGGYINFAASITFVFTIILFILYLTRFIHRLPGPWIFIESVSILLSILFHAIAVIVGAVSHRYGGGAVAAAVFCAINAVVYGVEMFIRFRIRHNGGWTFTASAMDGDIAVVKTTTTETTTTVTTHDAYKTPTGNYGDQYSMP